MSDQIKLIGKRIKELRRYQVFAPPNFQKSWVSIKKYLEYESGNIDIPVSFLYKIATKFGVEL